MTKIAHSVVSRESFISSVSGRVAKGDKAALAILTGGEKAQALNYVPFLESQAKSHKLKLVDCVASLTDDERDWVVKSLRPGKGETDSPQLASFKLAMAECVSSEPIEWSLIPTGEMLMGAKKEPSKCSFIVAIYRDAAGKKQECYYGLKKWSWILSLTDADRAAIAGRIAEAHTRGLK